MKQFLKPLVPASARPVLRLMRQRLLMAAARLVERTGAGLPPDWLHDDGDGDFRTVGERYRRLLVMLAGLQPHHRVLDIGCGSGRLAGPLTGYLGPHGSYEGLDIRAAAIDWCRRTIMPRHPQFRFHWLDIYNRAYNPRGRTQAAEVRFPFADSSFDVIVLTSVFTHLLPAEVENYLCEVARLLKADGRCLITWFLLNAESRRRIAAAQSALTFPHAGGGCWIQDRDMPEAAVAYDEADVRRLYPRCGLAIAGPIHAGGWCGRLGCLDGQDIIIARRD
jgi:SAM-dependent methyltransferase